MGAFLFWVGLLLFGCETLNFTGSCPKALFLWLWPCVVAGFLAFCFVVVLFCVRLPFSIRRARVILAWTLPNRPNFKFAFQFVKSGSNVDFLHLHVSTHGKFACPPLCIRHNSIKMHKWRQNNNINKSLQHQHTHKPTCQHHITITSHQLPHICILSAFMLSSRCVFVPAHVSFTFFSAPL